MTELNPITKEYLGIHGGIPDVLHFELQTQEERSLKWEIFIMYLYDNNKAVWFTRIKAFEIEEIYTL